MLNFDPVRSSIPKLTPIIHFLQVNPLVPGLKLLESFAFFFSFTFALFFLIFSFSFLHLDVQSFLFLSYLMIIFYVPNKLCVLRVNLPMLVL